MGYVQFAALAREVVEHYGDDIGAHPVGTGPFMLKHWRRAHRIVLEANPDFREMYLESQPSEPGDEEVIRAIGGKRLPIIGRVEVFVIEENQPRWLAFLNGEHDLIQWVPNEFINTVSPDGKLAAYLANRGIRMVKEVHARTGYTYFNLDDPMVGGYDPPQVALRRAVTLAYNRADEIRIVRKGQAIGAQSPIPPGVLGYDPAFRSPTIEHNPPRRRRSSTCSGSSTATATATASARMARPSSRARLAPRRGIAPVRRALAKEPGRRRDPNEIQEGALARSPEGVRRGKAPDVELELVRRVAGRGLLHVALLRPRMRRRTTTRISASRNTTGCTSDRGPSRRTHPNGCASTRT
jgi:hypothetical protein